MSVHKFRAGERVPLDQDVPTPFTVLYFCWSCSCRVEWGEVVEEVQFVNRSGHRRRSKVERPQNVYSLLVSLQSS